MNPPCKDCEKRQVGCHGSCPDYAAYAQSRQELREKARLFKEVKFARDDGYERMEKKKRLHGGHK